MSTSLLVSLLAAQVIGILLFFTDAFPADATPILQLALALALGSAASFFVADMIGRAITSMRRRFSQPYRQRTSS
jgi:hypothetical protein